MNILIDTNILINAITHRSYLAPKDIHWGDKTHTVNILTRGPSPPREDEIFRIQNIPYLASICLLARQGFFEFYRSIELRMERVRHKGKFYNQGYVGVNFFEGIQIKPARSPIERTIYISPEYSCGTDENEQMSFFKSINHPRFIELRKLFNKDSYIDDISHYWTAEFNELDVFLTMDNKFYETYIKNKRKIISSTQVMIPKELCIEMSIPPTDIEEYAKNHIP